MRWPATAERDGDWWARAIILSGCALLALSWLLEVLA